MATVIDFTTRICPVIPILFFRVAKKLFSYMDVFGTNMIANILNGLVLILISGKKK